MHRTIIAVAVMFSSLPVFGGALTPRSHSFAAVDPGSRREAALEKALRTFMFDDGTEWITHVVVAPKESSPIGVTRFDRAGTAKLFLASDWLPHGTIPGGAVGQIYALARADSGELLASVGWNHHGEVHNAVLTLREQDDGYVLERMIELAGSGDLAAGPGGTILVVTSDASVPGGGPLLTVFDSAGRVVANAFPRDATMPARAAASNAIRARLQRLSGLRYFLYDPAREIVTLFAWSGGKVSIAREIFVGAEAGDIVALTADHHGKLFVARTGSFGGVPGTIVTAYGDRETSMTWRSPHPWNAALTADGSLRGVVARDGIRIESVDFGGD